MLYSGDRSAEQLMAQPDDEAFPGNGALRVLKKYRFDAMQLNEHDRRWFDLEEPIHLAWFSKYDPCPVETSEVTGSIRCGKSLLFFILSFCFC